MKKGIKTELTREKIIGAALQEFGISGYEGASVNAVCERHKISKGLIYYNFCGKDEIYLICVERVFEEMTNYITCNLNTKIDDPEAGLREYLAVRTGFFTENPLLLRIFCEAVVFPPTHLEEAIEELKNKFDNKHTEIIRELIADLKLRADVSKSRVTNTLCRSFDLMDAVSQIKALQRNEIQPVEERARSAEERGCAALDILLYGMAAR